MGINVNAIETTNFAGLANEEMTAPAMSPTERVEIASLGVSRTLICDWATSAPLANKLVGRVSGTALKQTFNVPARYTGYATGDGREVAVTRVTVDPFGKSSNAAVALATANWTKAKLTVEYGPAPPVGKGIFMLFEEDMDPAVEFITLPQRKLYWDNAQQEPLGEDEVPGHLTKSIDWLYTLKRMPFVPPNVFAHQGKVNSTDMYSPYYDRTFGVGQVLYVAPEFTTTWIVGGFLEHRIELRFQVRPDGWNVGWKAGNTTPQQMYDDVGANFNQYDSADLNDIIIKDKNGNDPSL